MTSKLGSTGYLLLDNRNSPGVAPRPGFICSDGLFEADTYTCPHCHRVVLKNPLRERERNVCRKCMRITCDGASCVANCLPMARLFDVAATQAERDPNRVEEAINALRKDLT